MQWCTLVYCTIPALIHCLLLPAPCSCACASLIAMAVRRCLLRLVSPSSIQPVRRHQLALPTQPAPPRCARMRGLPTDGANRQGVRDVAPRGPWLVRTRYHPAPEERGATDKGSTQPRPAPGTAQKAPGMPASFLVGEACVPATCHALHARNSAFQSAAVSHAFPLRHYCIALNCVM